MKHAAEFRRCLLELDTAGIRRIWHHVAPHLHHPQTDEEALVTMHMARVKMRNISKRARDYSASWLEEREQRRMAAAVGIAIMAPPRRMVQALDIRHEMSESVWTSLRDGLRLDDDAPEVSRRMKVARERARRKLY